MPDITPRIGLKKPLGNENVSRNAYNENLDIIDRNVLRQSELDAHLAETMPHQFVDGGVTYRWGLQVQSGHMVLVYEEVS